MGQLVRLEKESWNLRPKKRNHWYSKFFSCGWAFLENIRYDFSLSLPGPFPCFSSRIFRTIYSSPLPALLLLFRFCHVLSTSWINSFNSLSFVLTFDTTKKDFRDWVWNETRLTWTLLNETFFDLNAVKRDSLDWNGTWMKRKLILLLFETSLALFK